MSDSFYLWNRIDKGQLWLKEDEENPLSWSVIDRVGIQEIIGRSLEPGEVDRGRELVGRDDYVWVRVSGLE